MSRVSVHACMGVDVSNRAQVLLVRAIIGERRTRNEGHWPKGLFMLAQVPTKMVTGDDADDDGDDDAATFNEHSWFVFSFSQKCVIRKQIGMYRIV